MTSSPLAPNPSASSAAGGLFAGSKKTLGRDAFLQLLVAQLSNQDPLNPQEGHEFAAQLAQFSSVEQLANIGGTLAAHSDLLAKLAAQAEASASQQAQQAEALGLQGDLASAAGLIGQTVEARGGHAVWDGATPATLGVSLKAPAASVQVVVRDAAGRAVRTLSLGHLGAGRHTPTWDGLTDDGQTAPPGAYSFTIEAAGPDGGAVPATPFTRGRVDRVTIEPDGVRFWIGPRGAPMSDLISLVS